MYARRRSGRSFPSRRRFGGAKMQTPHRPRKWERGNVYFSAVHDHSANQDLLTVVVLAAPNTIGDSSQVGVAGNLSQAVRYLEIGGLVYSITANPQWESTSAPPEGGDFGNLDCRALIVSDRTDDSTPPQPVSLNCDWFTNTLPVTSAAASEDANAKYPTQIHHQEYWNLNFGTFPGEALEITTVPRVQTTETVRRSRSQRLRLRLDDTQVLCLHLASHVRSSSEVTLRYGVHFNITGTIYYRFVFGSR